MNSNTFCVDCEHWRKKEGTVWWVGVCEKTGKRKLNKDKCDLEKELKNKDK